MPIRPPWFLRKKNEPQFFRVRCRECDFKKCYEVTSSIVIYTDPDEDHSSLPKVVEKLPDRCPICGGKLEKIKIPSLIRY